MDTYNQIAYKIISDQSMIMGPLAVKIAERVGGIVIDEGSVALSADPKTVLKNLVLEYKKIFGEASVEICKESAHNANLSTQGTDLPDILK